MCTVLHSNFLDEGLLHLLICKFIIEIKSVGTFLLLVPHHEALALPITVRTSNAETHAVVYINPLQHVKHYKSLHVTIGIVYTTHMSICLLLSPLTVSQKLARFRDVKNRALTNAL